MKKITLCLLLICFLVGCKPTKKGFGIDGEYKLVGIAASDKDQAVAPSKLGFSGSIEIKGDKATIKLAKIYEGLIIDEESTITLSEEDAKGMVFDANLKGYPIVYVYMKESSIISVVFPLDTNRLYLIFEQ